MRSRRKQRAGKGTLHIIAALLISSAIVRLGAQAGPALAEATTEPTQPEMAQPSATGASATPKELLAALQARESRLAEREAKLMDRMQALRLAEAEIDEKLAALRAAEEQLSATIASADSAAETDISQLTSVYENMKPKEAAALFEEMPPQFAAGFLGLMRPDAAALIMTELEPETAYSFSVVLAGRNANVPTE